MTLSAKTTACVLPEPSLPSSNPYGTVRVAFVPRTKRGYYTVR